MDRHSIVETVEVTHEGEVHAASYYVEAGVIHAYLGGRMIMCPVGNVPAADTVRALLTGHLLQQARRADQAKRWVATRPASSAWNPAR
jgi:hypothetical protein